MPNLSDFLLLDETSAPASLSGTVRRACNTQSEELVATPYRHGGKEAAESFFLGRNVEGIANMARQSSPDYPATIYYAFKQSEIAQEGISSTGWADLSASRS